MDKSDIEKKVWAKRQSDVSKPVFDRPVIIKKYISYLVKFGYKNLEPGEETEDKKVSISFEGEWDKQFFQKLFNSITYNIKYNILFCTKFNRPLFENPEAKKRLEELIQLRHGIAHGTVDLEVVNINGNNVYIQCKSSPIYSSFDILSQIKEFTTQKFREEFPEFFEKGYSSLWSKHFMIHSDPISQVEKELFIDYHRRLFYSYKSNKDKPAGLVLEKVHYDILFVTRRNRELIHGEFEETLKETILIILKKDRWKDVGLTGLRFAANFCNISVSVPGRVNPNKLIYDLKRESFSVLKKKYSEMIKETALWTHSYLISTQEIPINVMLKYIEFHKANFTGKFNK